MTRLRPLARKPRELLHAFVCGSLLVLLVCLCVTALVFSSTFLEKDRARARISADQLGQFFEFQYRSMGEEMWTKNYEAIRLRVGDIARQFGNAGYELVLWDEEGTCVYSFGTACRAQASALIEAGSLPGWPKAVVRFDDGAGRYVYAVPLYIGAVHKGHLFAAITDSFEFYRGGRVGFALKVFVIPMGCMVLVWFAWLFLSERLILRPYLASLVEMEKHQALGELAAQVVHDIRSPLVALKSAIGAARGWEDDQRRLITAAASRIENIADDLIVHFTGREAEESEPFSFLLPVVDAIVAEKTAMLGGTSAIEIRRDLPQDLGAMSVPISAPDLSRVLSNLLNNAIDALRDKPKGLITVSAVSASGRIAFSVRDDGKGMDQETLHRLQTMGGTYGKAGGAGIGLQHAKATLARVGGSLTIESTQGHGTVVALDIPPAKPPRWCAGAIDVSDAESVVVLDDDPSVHLLWRQRLGEDRLVALVDPEQFDVSRFPPEKSRFILDQEISGSPVTGLDLIVTHGLAARAVLVTSHFNEPKLQRAIEKAGATMLPKFMVGMVAIRRRAAPKAARPQPRRDDAVLIDDDALVRLVWGTVARRRGKALRAYASVAEFLAEADGVDLGTPIYVDHELADGVAGAPESARIHALGFTEIYLATGHDAKQFAAFGHLRGVVGKEPPWAEEVSA